MNNRRSARLPETLGEKPASGLPVGGLRVSGRAQLETDARQGGGLLDNTTVLPILRGRKKGAVSVAVTLTYASAKQRKAVAQKEAKRTDRRAARWGLRDAAQAITTLPRMCGCGRFVGKGRLPQIRVAEGEYGPVAHYGNLQLCGMVWTCPVCAPRIRAARATEINEALGRWISAHGEGSVIMATLTLPHLEHERLAPLLSLVADGFARMTQGKSWAALKRKYGITGYIRSHDLTHGGNGWHPHLHIAFTSEKPISKRAAAALRARLFRQWRGAIVSLGHRPPSPRACRLEVARNAEAVGQYITQVVAGERGLPVAMEVARGDLKTCRKDGQRTPWEILAGATALKPGLSAAALDGVVNDLALWHEYEQATKGHHPIQWSRGLRALLSLGEEKTDEETTEEEVGGKVVYAFSKVEDWYAVLFRRTRPGRSSARLRLLRAAERWGGRGVSRLMVPILSAYQSRHPDERPRLIKPARSKRRETKVGQVRRIFRRVDGSKEINALTVALYLSRMAA